MRKDLLSPDLQRMVTILNDLFRLEQRVDRLPQKDSLSRYITRIKEQFAQWGLTVENPIGESFSETRTDCEASISGESTENLVIKDVIQPIIRHRQDGSSTLVQRAVVVVESES